VMTASSSDWFFAPFKSVVAHRAFGPRFSGDLYSDTGNIATLRTTDLSAHGDISYTTMPRAQVDEAKFEGHFLSRGDLVISRSGRVGTAAVFEQFDLPVLPGAFLIRFRLVEEVDPFFYRYFFNSTAGRALLLSVARGAAQQNLTIPSIESLVVPRPPKTRQDTVVAMLKPYDDSIECNRKRIALLEEAARLLYREWFVHLRFPGHEHVKLVHGMPSGWRRLTFDDVCDPVGGGTPSTEKPVFWTGGDIPWYTPTDVTRNSCLALMESEKKITEAGLRSSSAKMLPAGTVLMTSRASVGFFGIIDTPSCTNQGFISIVPHDSVGRMYLLQNLMHRVEEIRCHAGGATYKEISKGKFKALTVVMPTRTLLEKFEEQASELHGQVRGLHHMNRKLAQARDLLLPRLMSGEIAV